MGKTIGIDLGTTNSVVAHVVGDRVESIPNKEGMKTTPSIVLFGKDDVLVGELAKRQSVTNAGLVVRSAKRLIGRRFSEVADQLEDFPYEIVQLDGDRAGIKLSNDEIVTPEEVSSRVLASLRDCAEDFIGEAVESAVITVPAHFNDSQRQATKIAAEMADLNVLRIINEPTAAALAYGFSHTDRSQKFAIFDFGGGTFDISILQLQGDIFEVLSTNGNTQLGGDNIDLKLFQEFCDAILQQTGIDPTQDLQSVSRIREAAEKTKIELSSLASTHVALPFIVADKTGPKHFECDVTRDQFNDWMMPLFEQLFEPCGAAIRDAHLSPQELDEIILVGGSSRIPKVQEMVGHFFGKEPNRSINPDEAIGIGAAIQGGVMRGDLQEVLLLDVTPLSLGIELAGGIFKPLIDRNSSVPCEATRKFTTVVDNQESVLVHVLQGERAKASENRTIARFRLTGIPPMPKELPEIEVKFNIDADGILAVSAIDLTSGVSTGIQVEGYAHSAPLSESEIKKVLEDKAEKAKEDEDFLRTANRRAQAERVRARLDRILEEVGDTIIDEDLKAMKETMLRHDLSLLAADWMAVDRHEIALNELADKYEGAAEMHRMLNRQLDLPSDRGSKSSPKPALEAMGEVPESAEGGDGSGGGEAIGRSSSASVPTPSVGSLGRNSSGSVPGGGAAMQTPTPAKAPTPPPPPVDDEDEEDAPRKTAKKVGKYGVPLAGTDGRLKVEEDFDPSLLPPPPPPPV